MTESLTVLRTIGKLVMAKLYAIAPNGLVVKRDYSNARTFCVKSIPVGGIHDLLSALRRIETDPTACVIRGVPNATTNLNGTRRVKAQNGGTFEDQPRSFVMLDLDNVKLPPSASLLSDPDDVAQILVDLVASNIPELDGVTAVVHFSSSAGLDEQAEAEKAAGMMPRWDGILKKGGGIGAHVWYWLNQPVDGAQLGRWVAAVNARVGFKLVDPATLRTVQPHYTAAPIFGEGLRDPLLGRRTLLVEGVEDAAVLDIPEPSRRQAWTPGESGHASLGFQGWLDAIGGAEGFHGPINRAIASYVATNWPGPDTDSLKAALVERIESADPGGRSQSEIKRYASDKMLDARIAWVVGREQDKRDAMVAEAEVRAAQPIEPTYPDRSIPLKEATSRSADRLQAFADTIAAGNVPQLLHRKDVGGGKTFDAIAMIPTFLGAGRAVGRGPVLFAHPRHSLGDQIAADIRKGHPHLKVAIWRGQEALNPDKTGATMCEDLDLPRHAKAAGQSNTAGCIACPLAGGCAYLLQAHTGAGADVWVVPHNVLFLKPFRAWPHEIKDGHKHPVPPSVVIVDEDVTSTGVAGLNPLSPVQLAISALSWDAVGPLRGMGEERRAQRELLLHRRDQFSKLLSKASEGALFREALAGESVADSIFQAKEWAALEWTVKPTVKITQGTSRAGAITAFKDAAAVGFTKLRPMLGEMIAEFLESGDARSVNLALALNTALGREQGTGPAIRFAWRQDIHHGWRGPTLFLDATGKPEVLRHWAPDLEVEDTEIAAPHQYVVHVPDQEMGRTWLRRETNLRAVVDSLMVEVAQAKGEVLAIAQMAIETLLQDELTYRGATCDPIPKGAKASDPTTWRWPSGKVLYLAHHGNVTGMNSWSKVATIVNIGRPAMHRFAGERMAEVINGKALKTVPDAPGSWWPTVTAALRMADGTGRAVDRQPRHPDPLVEAYRCTVTEGAVLQGVGRPRGVRRESHNPVRVVILAALALPLTVHEAPSWNEYRPNRLEVAVAEAALFGRAMPLAPADMSIARTDLWPTAKAAERFLEDRGERFELPQTLMRQIYKGSGGSKILVAARYRKGLRGRWSDALVPIRRGRESLEALIGRVQAFELVHPDSPTQDPGLVPQVDSEVAEEPPPVAARTPEAATQVVWDAVDADDWEWAPMDGWVPSDPLEDVPFPPYVYADPHPRGRP
ncbi:hypothetical protein J8J14_21140 [Roseomonas sp. SSH11]|uniref:Uncharacterized protein n=1 Tax=Pararoseomonas baculiformis TaxID=2820812 RepID=A0ABS4AK75_9PROT|nr:hypothetical protein [Pararoseomonas baculiformis]MBP0447281.1 hypothetical protein [Pararoseomonas baculiformis]